MRIRRLRAALLPAAATLMAGAALTACAGGGTDPGEAKADGSTATPTATATPSTATPTTSTTPEPDDGRDVYVAVGASETVGIGADDPARQAWPRLLHEKALSRSEYVNVGVSGSTVGEALAAQLPLALAAAPDVATVWLAVNDITHLVPVQAYETQLRTLVHGLRRDGRTEVLVGNVPAVTELPAYRACLPGTKPAAGPCELPVVPPEAQVEATVAEFNAAIDRVADAEGATVVDLSARRDLTRLTGTDGFHPSTAGHRLVAASFAQALNTLEK